jgi:MFS family permease
VFSSRVVGALTAAPIADYLGRRNALIVAIALSLVAITMEFVATTNGLFFGGKLLSGMAVAAIEAVCGTYLAEAG